MSSTVAVIVIAAAVVDTSTAAANAAAVAAAAAAAAQQQLLLLLSLLLLFFFLLLTWNYRIQLLPILMASALSAHMHLLLNACVSRTQLCFSTITNKRHYRLIVCVNFRKPCSATVFEMSLGAFGLQLCLKRISLMIAIN